jgi:hypothetical protein
MITGKDIKNGSVSGTDVKNRSLHLADFDKCFTAKLKGAKGDIGSTGTKGTNGTNGKDGKDAVTRVTSDGGAFTADSSSVQFTSSGVTFGPNTNNSASDATSGGSFRDATLKGRTLVYSAGYIHEAGTPDNGDAPYLRIFIDNNGDGFDSNTVGTVGSDDHDVVFSPSTQPGACAGPATVAGSCDQSGCLIKHEITEGTVRYDDDPGSAADVSWDRYRGTRLRQDLRRARVHRQLARRHQERLPQQPPLRGRRPGTQGCFLHGQLERHRAGRRFRFAERSPVSDGRGFCVESRIGRWAAGELATARRTRLRRAP